MSAFFLLGIESAEKREPVGAGVSRAVSSPSEPPCRLNVMGWGCISQESNVSSHDALAPAEWMLLNMLANTLGSKLTLPNIPWKLLKMWNLLK